MYRWFTKENIVPLPVALLRNIEKNPDRSALDFYGRKITYAELGRQIEVFAKVVSSLSYAGGKERCVALFLPNIPQFVFSYYGAMLSGSIVAPINYVPLAKQLREGKPRDVIVGDELIKQFEYSRPSVIVVAEMFWPILEKVLERTRVLEKASILITSPRDFLPPLESFFYPAHSLLKYGRIHVPNKYHVVSLDPVMRCAHNYTLGTLKEYALQEHSLDEVAQLQYTGGTTGVPKGAMLTHRNLASNVWQCREQIGDLLPDGSSVFGALPFCHAYGLTVCMNMALLGLGGELFLVPEFSPKKVCRLIEKERVALFSGSSRMFERIKPIVQRYDLSSLLHCTTGAGKTPEETIRFFRENGVPLYEGYGLSEASPVVSFGLPKRDKLGKVGQILPETEVKIVDVTTGNELGQNETGELLVKGPQVMAGYRDSAEETAKAIRGGWLHTGDIFTRDEDGFLKFVDRMKNMGKIRGENVYGEPIREFLLECRGVKSCVVLFNEDRTGESVPIAMVVLENSATRHELIRHLGKIPNPLWMPGQIIEVDDATFDLWFDNVLSKINTRAAKEYYGETTGHKILFEAKI